MSPPGNTYAQQPEDVYIHICVRVTNNNDCLFHTRCTAWDMNMDMAIVIVNETWASAWDMNMDMSTRHGHEHVIMIETWAAH